MAAAAQKVLVVDDEADILAALHSYLKGALPGVDIVTAHGAEAALAQLEGDGVDLVLSDYKMPGMDGLALLQRSAELHAAVPRVLMTAFPDMELAIRALNEGRIQHFITKPLDPAMVRDVLKALLDERLARKQREAALARSLATMRQQARSKGTGP